MDQLSAARRSENMRRIKSRDTVPEMTVRKLVYGLGFRYRLHGADLPGHPDLVFRSRRKVIFVHGCFWHQHAAVTCRISRKPHSNTSYWLPKLERNVLRDLQNRSSLRKLGWKVMVIWECETTNTNRLSRKIDRFLGEEIA